MASSALNMKSQFRARSSSLPSRPHPIISQIDEQLCKLTATEAISSSTSNKIYGLIDLYDVVNNFLLLPQTQATFQESHAKQIDEVLDRPLRLMDVCGSTKDSLLKIKEETQQLQSVLRRRGDESRFENEVGGYLSSKKKAIKVMHRSLKDLKSTSIFSSFDNEATTTINILREVDGFTFQVFASLLSYISKAKPSSWYLVSKLMHSKHTSCADTAEVNEFEKVDAMLSSLIGNKPRKSSTMNADNVQKVLGKLESCIQDLEEGLECFLRRLIKTRVTLLNILNH